MPDVGELMYASYPSSVVPVSLENSWYEKKKREEEVDKEREATSYGRRGGDEDG